MSNSTMTPAYTDYGFTALPADITKTPPVTTSPSTVPITALAIPTTPLAARVNAYTRAKLSPDTYRHSLRVYSYGLAIARQCFPAWNVAEGSTLEETWFLTAMLHDIGTADEIIESTRLSYEFWAGVHALELLQDVSVSGGGEGLAPREQAESVCEAILRHQDVQEKGMISLMTRLIHLGTLLDNVGANAGLVSRGTIEEVVGRYPREGWSGCFKGTVEKEKRLKPYAMVSRIEGFEDMIMGNELMKQYD